MPLVVAGLIEEGIGNDADMPSLLSPTQKAALDPRSPIDSLKRAEWCAYGSMAASLAAMAVIPAIPVVGVAGLIGSGYGAYRVRKHRIHLQDQYTQLGQRKKVSFNGNRAPIKRNVQGKIVSNGTWEAEWVPFEMRLVSEQRNGSEVKVQRKVLWLEEDWADVLERRRSWLQKHYPERLRLVQIWWMDLWVRPLVSERMGPPPTGHTHPKEAIQAATALAGSDMKVEYEIGVAIACQQSLWTRRLGVGPDARTYVYLIERLWALHATESKDIPPPPPPQKSYPRLKDFFFGHGFIWDQKHTQNYEDLKIRDASEVKKAEGVQGDPRIYNQGIADACDQFVDETYLNTHVLILGSTGVGKTRFLEPLLVQAIQSNFPVWIIDPKPDAVLTERACEETRRCGRGHQWRYMTLVTPRNPESYQYIATYNPLYFYGHHSELVSRISSTLPDASDKFWGAMANALSGNCMGIVDNLRQYLSYIGMDRRTRAAMPRTSRQVPKLLLAMAWARSHHSASPAEAEAAVDVVLQAMKNPNWQPTQDQRPIVDLIMTKSLDDMPIYSPVEWNPAVRHIAEYELNNTTAFLGWALKIFYFHLYLADEAKATANFPATCPDQAITSKNDAGSMWSLYQKAGFHPLQVRWEPHASMPPHLERWKEFMDYFVPEATDPQVREKEVFWLQKQFFPEIRRIFQDHYTDCVKERKEFINHSATLTTAIKPFLGDKGRLLNSLDPDATWQKLIEENLVVYSALGSMVDPVGAIGVGKMMVQDCAAFVGELYSRTPEKIKPFYLICDEISSFINTPMIDLLNKSRGAGARIILLGQTNADLVTALGSPEKAKMVKGNCNTVIQLRSQALEDAEDFAKRTGKVNVLQVSRSTSTTPAVGAAGSKMINEFQTNENRSFQAREVERVPPSSVVNLDRGQAFVHTRGECLLVAQGMFSDPQTRYLQECGLNSGTMYTAYPHVLDGIRRKEALTSSQATTPNGPLPGAPSVPPAAPSSGVHGPSSATLPSGNAPSPRPSPSTDGSRSVESGDLYDNGVAAYDDLQDTNHGTRGSRDGPAT